MRRRFESSRGRRKVLVEGLERIRLSTFGRVRAARFAMLATFDAPHFTAMLAVAAGELDEAAIGTWLIAHVTPNDG